VRESVGPFFFTTFGATGAAGAVVAFGWSADTGFVGCGAVAGGFVPGTIAGEDGAGGVWIVGVWGTGAFTGAPAAACAQRGADIDSKMVADKLRTLARNCM